MRYVKAAICTLVVAIAMAFAQPRALDAAEVQCGLSCACGIPISCIALYMCQTQNESILCDDYVLECDSECV